MSSVPTTLLRRSLLWAALAVPVAARQGVQQHPVEAGGAAGEVAVLSARASTADEGPQVVGEPVRRAVTDVFKLWRQAVATGDEEMLGKAFEVEMLVERTLALAPVEAASEPLFAVRFRKDLSSRIVAPAADPWTDLELMSAVVGDRPGRVVATVRVHRKDGPARGEVLRWWLRKTEEGWKVYDRESLETGLRLSELAAAGLGELDDAPGWTKHVTELADAVQRWGHGDRAGFDVTMRDLQGLAWPDSLAAALAVLGAQVASAEGDDLEALELLDRARQRRPDLPGIDRVAATVLSNDQRWDEAVAAARRYSDALGTDPELDFVEGRALAALGENDEAAAVFRRGLETDPQNVDDLLGLAQVLPPEGAQELRDRFRRLDDPVRWFEPLARSLLANGDLDDVATLVGELRRIAPSDPNGDYYAAALLEHDGKYREAANLLQAAFPKVSDPKELQFYVERYIEVCLSLGEPLVAYENSPDKLKAFEILCPLLLKAKRYDDVRTMVQRQELAYPDDPWIPLYKAELQLVDGDRSTAVLRFEEGFLNAQTDDVREAYRGRLVGLMLESGDGLRALQKVAPGDATYHQVLGYALQRADQDLLDAVLEARRKSRPDDPEIPLVEGVRDFWKGDTKRALEEILAARSSLDPNGVLVLHVERALILSALREGRTDLAEREARISTQRDGDPFFEALVDAANGKVDEAVVALEACLKLGYQTTVLYADPDLGPHLRNDPGYAAFRARHPPTPADGGLADSSR